MKRHIKHGTTPEPNACRWCGIPKFMHCGQWSRSKGWHQWSEPTNAQRLARMRARRRFRLMTLTMEQIRRRAGAR